MNADVTDLELAVPSDEGPLGDLVELAARTCDAPMAALTELTATHERFRVRFGFDVTAVTREHSLSLEALTSEALTELSGAELNPAHPLVANGARFVASVPVGLPSLSPMGTLSVFDTKPRTLDATQRRLLHTLGREVSLHLQHRRLATREREQRERAQRQLERADKLATVGQLAAGLAHELGTPLAVITGRAKMLSSGSVPADQVPTATRVIVEQSERMAQFIRQLMDYARRREPKKARYDLRIVVRQARALLLPMANQAGVTLEAEEFPEPLFATFDATQLGQVLTNLIVNALHASQRGGSVRLALGSEGEGVFFSVRDSGSGIAPENLERIFEPFFTTKETGSGTGLGLPVALAIVQDHGGWIDVESELNHGATFTVRLPVSPPTDGAPAAGR